MSVFLITGLVVVIIGVGIYAFLEAKQLLPHYFYLTKERVRASADLQPVSQKTAEYTGSDKCAECHEEIFEMQGNSMHSKMIQDVKKDPTAIVGDFALLPEDANFSLADIVFTIGSKFKQRYMLAKEFDSRGDYVIGNYQWNTQLGKWQTYKVYKDWYGEAFEQSNNEIPTSLSCDGCHFVGFMGTEHRVEPAIRCESCHGPGSEHSKDPKQDIYKATNVDPQRAIEVCIQCHMRNRDIRMETVELSDLYDEVKDYPAGYEPGKPLVNYKMPAPFEPGVNTKEFWGNGAARKNRTQGNEYVRSTMYKHGITCIDCHNPHSTDNTADNPLGDTSCMSCHKFGSLIGPHQPTIEVHTHHEANSTGSSCIECHMPKTGRHLGSSPLTVRTHLFGFIYPEETRKYDVPNGCNSCHKDESLEWSEKYLKEWGMQTWEIK